MIKLHFELSPNDVQLSRIFENIAGLGDDLRPVLEPVSDDFYRGEASTFEAEGGFEGKARWKKLSKGYRAWKDKHYPGQKIMVLTGKLKESLTTRGATGSIFRLDKKSLELGTGISYAMKHQRGLNVSKRKLIQITGGQKHRWSSIVHQGLYKKAGKEWSKLRGH